jgi:hypothetical protein
MIASLTRREHRATRFPTMGRTSTVIRRAVELGRGRAPFLFGLAALIFVPLGLIDAIDEATGGIDTDALSNFELLTSGGSTALHVVSAVLGGLLYAGAVAIAVISTAPGEDPTLARIIRETRWWTLIAVDLLFTLGMVIGLLLLVIPGLIFFARYALVATLAEIEELGIRDAFRRSAELSRGAGWLVLGLLLSVTLAADLAGAAITAAMDAISADHFVAHWIAAAGTDIALNPVFALLAAALVLQLGGRPAHPHPDFRA